MNSSHALRSTMKATSSSSSVPPARFLIAQGAALAVGLGIGLSHELPRIRDAVRVHQIAGWFGEMDLKTTPFFLLLIALPLFWCPRRPQRRAWGVWFSRIGAWFSDDSKSLGSARPRAGLSTWVLAIGVAVASVAVSGWISARPVALSPQQSVRFGDLPPAYHDEFSYLFQAKTFLAGRLLFPSHPEAPELFDQMHVLNDDGRFASRFFPGTGLWIAPFLAFGKPYWGHWLAGALSAFLVFWTGRELAGNGVGCLAGLLTALSPGMALFSNLLLAHHPGLAGLTLFLFAFLRMIRTAHWGWALTAGMGLSFAMLCRPMTAAGFALPCGLWFAGTLLRGARRQPFESPGSQSRMPLKLAAAMAMPILLGLAVVFAHSRAITGSGWITPYQRFTEIYTPRHVYGFDNVIRGEKRLGPKVIEKYDRWTENLSPTLLERDDNGRLVPSLAVRNVFNRLTASLQWSLALIPLAMAAVVFLVSGPGSDRRWWFVLAAIVSLHAVHVPYWYDGIMHWHYVFENGPLWLLIFASATQTLFGYWHSADRPLMPLWWCGLTLTALLTTYTSPEPFWQVSRIESEVNTIAFSRKAYARFEELVARQLNGTRGLVLIEDDPADRHIDYVNNGPDLKADVLFGRFRPGQTDLDEVQRLFPDRTCYLYRARKGQFLRIPRPR